MALDSRVYSIIYSGGLFNVTPAANLRHNPTSISTLLAGQT